MYIFIYAYVYKCINFKKGINLRNPRSAWDGLERGKEKGGSKVVEL